MALLLLLFLSLYYLNKTKTFSVPRLPSSSAVSICNLVKNHPLASPATKAVAISPFCSSVRQFVQPSLYIALSDCLSARFQFVFNTETCLFHRTTKCHRVLPQDLDTKKTNIKYIFSLLGFQLICQAVHCWSYSCRCCFKSVVFFVVVFFIIKF